MSINRPHRDVLNHFLEETHVLQEKIINKHLDDPGKTPEDRIINRFTRDMQLIVTKTLGEVTKLPNGNTERAIVHMSCSMLQGVASICAAYATDADAAEQIITYFRDQMESFAEERDYKDR